MTGEEANKTIGLWKKRANFFFLLFWPRGGGLVISYITRLLFGCPRKLVKG